MKTLNIVSWLILAVSLFDSSIAATIQVPQDAETIAAALESTENGDTVLIDDGVYSGEGNRELFLNQRLVILSRRGPTATTIDLEFEPDVPAFSPNVSGTIIEGIRVIRAGHWAMNIRGVSITIRDCIFEAGRCQSNLVGVGLRISNATVTLERTIFTGNYSVLNPGGGCGIYATEQGRAIIDQCEFTNNTSVYAAAALYLYGDGVAEVTNSLFASNVSRMAGGAIQVHGSRLTMSNCTIARNRTGEWAGAIYKYRQAIVTVSNSIIAWNEVQQGAANFMSEIPDERFTVTDCLVQGGEATGRNVLFERIINGDPNFREAEGQPWGTNGYFIDPNSPCVDVGSVDAEEAGLSDMTTQTNLAADEGRVDLGYHYERGIRGRTARLFGYIVDAANGEPMAEVSVSTTNEQIVLSDEEGYWEIVRPLLGDFSITASMPGYNDSTYQDQEIGDDDTLQLDFGMLHPEFRLSVDQVEFNLPTGDSSETSLQVINEGNGKLTWYAQRLPMGERIPEPLELELEIIPQDPVSTAQLVALIVIDRELVVAGNRDDTNFVFRLNPGGELIEEFIQPSQGEGFTGLASDGMMIWGVDRDSLYMFSPAGEVLEVNSIDLNGRLSLTFDSQSQHLWAASSFSDIIGLDINGAENGEIIPNAGLNIFGLAYNPDDPTGKNLIVIDQSPDNSFCRIFKINTEDGSREIVGRLEFPGVSQARGGFVSDDMAPNSFSFVFVMDMIDQNDWIESRYLASNVSWLSIDPRNAIVDPGTDQSVQLIVSADGLAVGQYRAMANFHHDAMGFEELLPIELNIIREQDVDSQTPGIADKFELDLSISPNPFNSSANVSVTIPHSGRASIRILDITGREVGRLQDGELPAGRYELNLNAEDLSAGVYFCMIETQTRVVTAKFAVLR